MKILKMLHIVSRLNSEINRLNTTPEQFTGMVKRELELGARFARMVNAK